MLTIKIKKMKTLKSIAVILIASMFITNSSIAQTNASVKTNQNFSVKYIGVEGDYRYFFIDISGIDAKDKTLKINDKVEGELYAENWNAKSSLQKFKIERKDGQILTFNLSTGKKEYSKTYSFSTQLTENNIVKEDDLVIL
jgi:outer membrane protease